ncbi:MAG: molybdopterin cofactor-binding domain-containing protein [Steroidobacteraceae bacterium]
MRSLTRRLFIAGAVASAGGGLLVASLPRLRQAVRAWRAAKPLGEVAWIQIQPDGMIRVFTNVTDMGQGAITGLLQGVAEELDVEWSAIRYEMAPVRAAYSAPWGYSTGGSRSVRRLLLPCRQIAASARVMLVAAAAARWNVQEEACVTGNGRVVHMASGRHVAYAAIAAEAARLRVPTDTPLRPASEWRVMGKSMAAQDLPEKVNGQARFGIDVQLPGLLVATIGHAPRFGARLAGVDAAPALSVPGVLRVIQLPDAVAVVARAYWPAQKGLRLLRADWQGGDPLDTDVLGDSLKQLLHPAGQAAQANEKERGALADAEQLLSGAGVVDAVYEVPLLAQAPLEPMNATARPGPAGGVEMWVPTQAQSDVQQDVAAALAIDKDSVVIHSTRVGGGFGRRLATDYAVQAAKIMREMQAPVKLVWSREEDFRHSTYRTMARARLRARLAPDGIPSLLRVEVATLDTYRRVGGLDDAPYTLPDLRLSYAGIDTAIPIGSWRSVDMSQNTFFLECFLDECAEAANRDPFDYRAALLPDKPRERAVLESLRALSGWDSPAIPGIARGMAFAQGFGSTVGQVVELRSEGGEAFSVSRVFCVLDCGFAVNPRAVEAQVEGGVLYGLSAALSQRIDVRNGAVVQSGFADYPVLRMMEAPRISIKLLSDAQRDPGGVGEIPVPVVAPALANALYRLRGWRERSLPLRKDGR